MWTLTFTLSDTSRSATQAIAAGFDAVTVSARLGHADPSITLRVYSHALKSRDRDLAASLGRTLGPPASPEGG
jgi:integrase